MKTNRLTLTALVAALVLAGCSTMPERNARLEQARSDYSAAQSDPRVVSLAGGELRQAGETLDRANHASNKRDDAAVVDQLAYLAGQQVTLARETAGRRDAELSAATANTERDRARLDARTREADNAQRSAEAAQRQSENSQRNAEAAQRQSEAAQRSAEASQRQSEASQRQAADLQRQATTGAIFNAEAARLETQDAQARSRQLEERLRDLEAKKTNRGMVITMGDMLFDTNRSQLKSGGMRNVQKLADFFRQYPQRTVMIEGHTDSSGNNERNQELSEQRATSVRMALLDMGIATERIVARGYGESFPVAANDTAAGRQLNRRVEIIVSDESGKIAPR